MACLSGAEAAVECAGEEETDLDVGEMVRKGEVAWLNAEEMKAAAEPSPSAYSAPENGETRTLQCPVSASAGCIRPVLFYNMDFTCVAGSLHGTLPRCMSLDVDSVSASKGISFGLIGRCYTMQEALIGMGNRAITWGWQRHGRCSQSHSSFCLHSSWGAWLVCLVSAGDPQTPRMSHS